MKKWALIHNKKGFTVVELAVVVTVIAILAAITVAGYGTWRQMIATDEVKNDLKAAASAMENARNFSSGYPTAIPASYSPSENVTLTYARGDVTSFCLNATNKKVTSVAYFYESSKKEVQEGSCSGTMVSNLVINPRPTAVGFYNPSPVNVGQVSFFKNSAGDETVRSTRLTAGNYALYVGRSVGGITTAKAGDVHTIMYTITSSVSTNIQAMVGYGTGTAAIPGEQTVALTANTPKQVRHTVTVQPGYDGQPLFIKVWWGSGVAGDYFDVSNMMWVAGAYTGGYADGNSPNWRWQGSANGSVSSGIAP